MNLLPDDPAELLLSLVVFVLALLNLVYSCLVYWRVTKLKKTLRDI